MTFRPVSFSKREMIPLCQDTGTTVVMAEVGQDVHIVGGSLRDAINRGVGKGYTEGYLRASIVDHPFSTRVNTKDNTPAVIHTEIVPGDKLRFTVTDLDPRDGVAAGYSLAKDASRSTIGVYRSRTTG